MEDRITGKKLAKYFDLTERALAEVKKNIFKNRTAEGEEIISMVENYLSDAHHFEKKGEWVDAFAALNYAHGWLDSGVRLKIKIFDVWDNELFTIR